MTKLLERIDNKLFFPLYLMICLMLGGLTIQAQSGFSETERQGIIKEFSIDLLNVSETDLLFDVVATESDGSVANINGKHLFNINKEPKDLFFKNGKVRVKVPKSDYLYVQHDSQLSGKINQFFKVDGDGKEASLSWISLWWSVVPPLLAILFALLFREVFVSLFAGIWLGAWILNGFSLSGLFYSFLQVVEKYIIGALNDADHLAVIVFSLLIGAMVGIISKNGGMAGIVDKLSGLANSARNSQLITWCLGLAIFFDDYANTLIVGNTVRPITDRFRVSREKLSYIVDSTAAPVAAVAFVTTWIGAELGFIQDSIETLNIDESAYSMFLNSLAYSFYPFLTLAFILILVLTKKDYGPMLKAELRARETGKVSSPNAASKEQMEDALDEIQPIEGAPRRWYNALLPVLTVIAVTLIGLVYTGYSADVWNGDASFFNKVSTTIGDSNSYTALLWSSMSGVVVAMLLTIGGRIMDLNMTISALLEGIKTMLPAIIILTFAWSLAQITKELHTADYLTSLVAGNLSPYLMPMITFLLSGLIAFATGSSWGTMAILYPLLLPTTWSLCASAGVPPEACMPIFYSVISSVLAGSVFGDHCSPISDTTILSSLATNCNHIDHVRTQMPYAMTVGIVSVLLGTFAVYVGLPFIINIAIGLAILGGIVIMFGKEVPDYTMEDERR